MLGKQSKTASGKGTRLAILNSTFLDGVSGADGDGTKTETKF